MPIFSFIGYTLTELFRKPEIDHKFINKRVRLFIHQTMSLKSGEKKKILGRLGRLQNGCLITFKKIQRQPPEMLHKKAVL